MEIYMKNSLFVALSLCITLSACSDGISTDQIWKDFVARQGQGYFFTLKDAEIIKSGTVDAQKALITATQGRLPAYLVLFKYNTAYPGMGDINSEMYVYYVYNTENKTNSMMWRGEEFINVIYDEMSKDDFK